MENEKNRQTEPESEAADQGATGAEAAGSDAASAAPEDPAALNQKLLREKQELYDRLLRKQAELENFRKRMQREKEEFLQHATADLVRALLPTLDGLERALKHRDASVPEQFYKGIELIYKQLSDVLGGAGLAPVETAGQIFDPHLHQAVETVERPGYRDHEIVEELQKGYKLKQRLLRPAVVKVAVSGRGSGAPGEKAPGAGNGQTSASGRAEN
jgi:molecular chaperone GrpE